MEAAAPETNPLGMNKQKLHTLAGDLRKTPPRSPARRSAGLSSPHAWWIKPALICLGATSSTISIRALGAYFWKFPGLDAAKFKEFVATGASDEEIDGWVPDNATQKNPKTIIKCNHEMIGLRLCDLPEGVQEYFETYIPQFCNPESKMRFFFDVYDVEESVL